MRKQKSTASEYTLDEHDVRRIIDSAPKSSQYVWSIRNRVILELLAFTGCRREELVLLRFMDVLFDHEMILMPTVKQEKRKNAEKKLSNKERIDIAYQYRRRIPFINDTLKRDLQTYIELIKNERRIIETHRLIQSRQSNSITSPMINNIVLQAGKNANVSVPNPNRKHIHPHMFRHTFVRYARRMGMDYVAIQEIVGHSDISTTMGMYGKPTWEDKVAEAKKMKDFGKY